MPSQLTAAGAAGGWTGEGAGAGGGGGVAVWGNAGIFSKIVLYAEICILSMNWLLICNPVTEL